MRAVATSAVREAENRHVFIRRAAVEAGVQVEVISGFEEARLIHLGVLQAVPVYDRRVLVVDIGGGSTEIVLGERDEVVVVRSLKLGAIRLTHRFFPDDVFEARTVTGSARHPGLVAAVLREIDLSTSGWASSGTVEACPRWRWRPGASTARTSTRPSSLARSWRGRRGGARRAHRGGAAPVPDLDAGRGDILVAGALMLEEVLAGFGASR